MVQVYEATPLHAFWIRYRESRAVNDRINNLALFFERLYQQVVATVSHRQVKGKLQLTLILPILNVILQGINAGDMFATFFKNVHTNASHFFETRPFKVYN